MTSGSSIPSPTTYGRAQRSREQGIEVKGAELIFEPNNPTAVSIADAKKVQRLIDKLEEFDDVQNVYSTMDITDEVAAALDED